MSIDALASSLEGLSEREYSPRRAGIISQGEMKVNYQYITFENDGDGVATITMNRPEAMNSINLEMVSEMSEALDICAADRKIRVIVVTGGNGVFSAGDDIKIMSLANDKTPEEIANIIENQGYPVFIKKAMSIPKPVIACVNGPCYGAGGEIALSCDYIMASDKASFGQLYVNVGLIGNTYLLPRLVGSKKALELIWTGRIITAQEAHQLGMINEVVPDSELMERLNKLVRRLSQGPTLAYGLAKKAVYGSTDLGLAAGLSLMCYYQGQLMKSKDHQEAVKAFLSKSKPQFVGE